MAIMNFVSQHILLVAVIVVILFFIIRYLYISGYFNNFGLAQIETKSETLEDKQNRLKLLNEELKIKQVENKINKYTKSESKPNNFFDTNVASDIGSSDDFFNTNVEKDIKGGG